MQTEHERFQSYKHAEVEPVQFELRCPQCSKLYKVEHRLIHTNHPHFDCSSCATRFSFEYPPQTLPIETRLVRSATNAVKGKGLVPCPRCQILNPRGATECCKCQVVLAKAEMMAKESVPSARPSLIKAWQELLSDYTNLRKHVEFVDRCEELQALPFAMRKYRDVKEAQPHDTMAQQMMNSVIVRLFGKQTRWLQNIPWMNIVRVLPVVIGVILVFGGLIRPGWRNFVGGGVSLVVLTLGFAYFLKGRLSWKDFWQE